jgi:hypothetical protein
MILCYCLIEVEYMFNGLYVKVKAAEVASLSSLAPKRKKIERRVVC